MYAICLRSIVSLLPVAVLALAVTGCTLLQPRPSADDAQPAVQPVATTRAVQPAPARIAAVEDARALMAKGRYADAVATLDRAISGKKGPEDALLMELGVALSAPEVADYARGREVLERLLKKHPRSPHRHTARALADLLSQLDRMAADNEALRQDLKQILDIDLEAERRRRGG